EAERLERLQLAVHGAVTARDAFGADAVAGDDPVPLQQQLGERASIRAMSGVRPRTGPEETLRSRPAPLRRGDLTGAAARAPARPLGNRPRRGRARPRPRRPRRSRRAGRAGPADTRERAAAGHRTPRARPAAQAPAAGPGPRVTSPGGRSRASSAGSARAQ